jgi:3-methyladenine DNA glycosylase AlkD
MQSASKMNLKLLVDEIKDRVSSLPVQKTEPIRAIRREFSIRIQSLPPKTVLQLAFELIRQKSFVYRWFAYELIENHGETLGSLNVIELEKLGKGIDSWYAVDSFACGLSGQAWRERQIPDSAIHRWASSHDVWWRRAALVSTVPLNNSARGGKGDTERTLRICKMLIRDREDMVVKAVSWSLRELSKKDSASVRLFLSEHKKNLAPRVIREVQNKLATGLKNPR